jgi:predicted RNA-binding Zn ribbon-like protein
MDLSPDKFPLNIAGLPCLELVNTRPGAYGGRMDLLGDFGELVSWLCGIGALEEGEGRQLVERWAGTPEAEETFATALRLRDALDALVVAITDSRAVPADAVDRINAVLASQPGVRQLTEREDGYEFRFQPLADEPLHLLVPIAESAAELLAHGDLSLLKRCENPACVLHFYDRTKNRSRRWCSMETCGSRIKAAAYYRRKRGTSK